MDAHGSSSAKGYKGILASPENILSKIMKDSRNGMETKYEIALREAAEEVVDLNRVFMLLSESLAAGDPRAAYALATWYLHGKHVQKDLRKAVKLLKIAAKAKIPDAIYDLAVCYEKGAGVRKNFRRAYELYMTAAIWSEPQSIYEVGRCLFYGIGARKDIRLSRIWMDRAKALKVK